MMIEKENRGLRLLTGTHHKTSHVRATGKQLRVGLGNKYEQTIKKSSKEAFTREQDNRVDASDVHALHSSLHVGRSLRSFEGSFHCPRSCSELWSFRFNSNGCEKCNGPAAEFGDGASEARRPPARAGPYAVR